METACWAGAAGSRLHAPLQTDKLGNWGLAVQVCRSNPGEKGRYIKFILALLQSTSTAVVYECAVTLVSLSQVGLAPACHAWPLRR